MLLTSSQTHILSTEAILLMRYVTTHACLELQTKMLFNHYFLNFEKETKPQTSY